jgi:hypothetical protein
MPRQDYRPFNASDQVGISQTRSTAQRAKRADGLPMLLKAHSVSGFALLKRFKIDLRHTLILKRPHHQ